MPSSSPVALVLGAGSNVGMSVGRAFAAQGYRVALAARSLKEENSTPDELHIPSDFSESHSIPQIFTKVKAKFGNPHVVVYNGNALLIVDPLCEEYITHWGCT